MVSDQLPAHHRVERVQRGQRILENRADLATTNLAHLFVRVIVDAQAIEQDLPAGDPPGGSSRADDGGAEGPLRAPDF